MPVCPNTPYSVCPLWKYLGVQKELAFTMRLVEISRIQLEEVFNHSSTFFENLWDASTMTSLKLLAALHSSA